MNFDNVQLPSTVIADLYRQTLVVMDDVLLKAPTGEPVSGFSPSVAGSLKMEPAAVVAPAAETVTEIKPVETAPAQPLIHYLGGFKKGVSIVLESPNHPDIAPADLEFLKKLMAACKLTLDDMAVINVVTNQPAAQQLWKHMPAKVVLLFGVSTNDVGIPFYRPDFQVQNWSDAFFMSAPPLAAFQGPDTPELKALKRELWDGLQKIFLKK